jgi:hypothetical protein
MSDGEIWRFRRGQEEGFAVSGLDEGVGEGVAIVTNEDMDSIYLLDRGKTRVVKINKEGAYDEQYVWEGLAAAEDIVVDEAGGRIMVLVGSSVYKIDM